MYQTTALLFIAAKLIIITQSYTETSPSSLAKPQSTVSTYNDTRHRAFSENHYSDNNTFSTDNDTSHKAFSEDQFSDNNTFSTTNELMHTTTAISINAKDTPSEQNNLKEVYEKLEYAQDMFVIPIVCTIGIIGNSLVASFLYEKRGMNSSFIYMFALLLADLLSLVSDLFLPIATVIAKSDSDPVRRTAANVYFWNKNFLTYVLRGTALNVLCVLSLERLMAIKYPLRLKTSWTVKKPQIFLFISFMIGFITNIQIPLFTEIGGVPDDKTNTTLYKRVYSELYLKDKQLSDKIVLLLHFFAGPVQIVFFSVINVFIVHGIYRNRKNLLAMNMHNHERLRTIKNLQVKLCKIFLVLSITNILAFLPNSVTTIVAKLFPELGLNIRDYSTQILLHGGNMLRVLNSMSDFIVMLAMSNEIRRDFSKRFLCRKASDDYVEKETVSTNGGTKETRSGVSTINGVDFQPKIN